MKPPVSTIPVLLFLSMLAISSCVTRGPFFQELEPQEQGMAIIYLFAQWNIAANSLYPIKANGDPLVKLVDGEYYPFRIAPGDVTFEIDTTAREKERLVLHAESGQTYFVQVIRMRYGGKLKLLTEEQAIHLITPCRLVVDTPEYRLR